MIKFFLTLESRVQEATHCAARQNRKMQCVFGLEGWHSSDRGGQKKERHTGRSLRMGLWVRTVREAGPYGMDLWMRTVREAGPYRMGLRILLWNLHILQHLLRVRSCRRRRHGWSVLLRRRNCSWVWRYGSHGSKGKYPGCGSAAYCPDGYSPKPCSAGARFSSGLP